MIGNDTIQAGIVAQLKSLPAITSLVTNSKSVVEIRELEWQGTDFEFPNIRVEISDTYPSREGCNVSDISFMVSVFSEDASSKQSRSISTTVANNLQKSFTYTSGGSEYLFSGIRVNSVGNPMRITERVWRNDLMYRGIVSGG